MLTRRSGDQLTFRFYDYDDRILEIVDIMATVTQRMHLAGKTLEEIAEKTGYPKEQVIEELKKSAVDTGSAAQ